MVKKIRFACFEHQRMLFLECWSVFVFAFLPTMFEPFSFVCPLFSEQM